MPHIFFDESGQFTTHNNENYFIVASFTVGNPRRTEKQFKSWQRRKFPKKLRYQPEIKFSEVEIKDELRMATLKFISDLDVRINFSYLLKQNIPGNYHKNKKLQSGLLYTNIIGETVEMYLPLADKELRVFCDERHLKGIKKPIFEKTLINRLLPQLQKGTNIQIEMIDSKENANIQIVDWIAGALAAFLEKKELGSGFYQILQNNILKEGKELFKDYWSNKYQN
ncbi:MAG: DUF3800 domain-containing protein [Patescibacteria group bacterium]|nr:DUF3800 domain-containing protein [Patescibacteria group bacterium]MDD5121274.1 DUF3800 domain-containing protein [Patescibacteria group bacterium]MDD5221833.1 DUF3800 domain-containing protein [Patescibacteria group bacterium]MDD5395807.1 DUF3800 domain-containing protein [Patescibacteria group bacterium]